MPVNATDCGEAAPLSAMVNEAEKEPVAVGANATYTVQLAEAASDAPQVSRATKAVGLAPVRAIDVRFKVAVPLLVSVTAFAADVVPLLVAGKAMLVTLSLTDGAAVPVPVSATV